MARRWLAGLLLAALMLGLAVTPRAGAEPLRDTITLQPGSEGLDAFIDSGASTTNFGASDHISVGENTTYNEYTRSLISFDLSSIPSGATVNSATLTLCITNSTLGGSSSTLEVFRALRTWTESSVTWVARDGVTPWAASGADGSGDAESGAIGTLARGVGDSGCKDISLNTAALQAMIPGGGFTNNGFLLRSDVENDDMYFYASSDNATAGDRPKLVIDYTPAGATSTPGATSTAASTSMPTLTPGPTATSLYDVDVQLPSGDHYQIERRISYGEIAVVLVGGLLLLVLVPYCLIKVLRLWI